MNFEHLVFFHGFTKQRSPETQRPCARLRDADRNMRSASGDPAMVFIFRMAAILSVVRAPCPLCPAAGLLLDVLSMIFRKTGIHFSGSCSCLRMIVFRKSKV